MKTVNLSRGTKNENTNSIENNNIKNVSWLYL